MKPARFHAGRIAAAKEELLAFLKKNPNASQQACGRHLNNSRYKGERLTLTFGEINRICLEAAAPQFNPPRLVVSPPANPPPVIIPPPPPTPPKPVPMEVAAPGTLETTTKFFIPGRAERQKYAEDVALEHPTWTRGRIMDEVKKKFGIGLDPRVVQSALEASRVLAGLKAKLRNPKTTPAMKPPPVPQEKPPMPLPDPPPPPLKPDAMLREAAGVLKLLVEKMGWQSLALTVDHKGEITYDAIPLPVLPAKGSLRL